MSAAPMLDALAAGLKECSRKPITGERLHFLDGFLNNMLRSRISRRVLAEQHLMLDVPR
jgi:[3-methyl-2-oxobutanoate dehydrogenase (acetyl-transferring)] kinase